MTQPIDFLLARRVYKKGWATRIVSRILLRSLAVSVLTVGAAGGAEISIVPVSASGAHTISGHDIFLGVAGQRVFLDVRVGGWDPDRDGTPKLRAWEADIDSSGYAQGIQGALAPASAACLNDSDCLPAFGGACSIGGIACRTDADCPFPQFGDTCFGPLCTYPLGVGGFCQPGFILSARLDYVFRNVTGVIPAVDTSTPDFRFGSTTQSGVVDPGPTRYSATLVLDVSADARGTFVVGLFRQDAEGRPKSRLVAPDFSLIGPLVLTPARIIIACSTSEDCDDGDECTDDFCLANGECSNTPNFNQLTSCCDPRIGAICARATGLSGDGNGDDRVDLRDFAILQSSCFGTDPILAGCETFDEDCNCRIDWDDLPDFVAVLAGPALP